MIQHDIEIDPAQWRSIQTRPSMLCAFAARYLASATGERENFRTAHPPSCRKHFDIAQPLSGVDANLFVPVHRALYLNRDSRKCNAPVMCEG